MVETATFYQIVATGDYGHHASLMWDNSGLVIIHGESGTWSHRWACRGQATMPAFLAKISPKYLATKLLGEAAYEIDDEKTVATIKTELLDWRRDGCLTREEARDEWNILRGYDPLFGHDFRWWMDETRLYEPGEYRHDKLCETFQTFWAELWVPHFQPELNRIAGAACVLIEIDKA